MIETGLAQRLQRAVGFRKLLAHAYTEVDRKIVLLGRRTGPCDLADLGNTVAALLQQGASHRNDR